MNDRIDYPDLIDWVWLAVDDNGHVAAFTTGGMGPVPATALRGDREGVERQVIDLPLATTVLTTTDRPEPGESFINLCGGGLTVYDWIDAEELGDTEAYHAVAVPETPLAVKDLPPGLQELAEASRIRGVDLSRPRGALPIEGVIASPRIIEIRPQEAPAEPRPGFLSSVLKKFKPAPPLAPPPRPSYQPATVCGGLNMVTGKILARHSGPGLPAEVAVYEALGGGSVPGTNIQFTTLVRPRTGRAVPPSRECVEFFGRRSYEAGSPFRGPRRN